MEDQRLLTIADLAKQLKIPESTIRFYRDRHEFFIPAVGSGRSKRYRPETAEVLKYIAEAYKREDTQEQIEAALGKKFAMNIIIDAEFPSQMPLSASQQPSEQLTLALGQIAVALETMALQKAEITELRQHIADLETQQRKQVEVTDAINKRIEQTDQLLIELRNRRQKKWWQFRK